MIKKDEAGRVSYRGEESNVYNILIAKPERNKHLKITG
jgi:hypothetical protein